MKKLFVLPIAILLVSSLALSCRKNDPVPESADELRTLALDEMDSERIPAMALLVFKNEQVIFEDYLGKSSLENNTDLQADDLFLIASISKLVTGTALLQLHDQGAFGLDDPINLDLPFEVSAPDWNTEITHRMLLTHTSSIADGPALDDQYYYGSDSPVALGDFLEDYLVPGGAYFDDIENFTGDEPGTAFEYSNTGTALEGHLVETISGNNFNDYCKQFIFSPLGMNDTYWRLDEISQTIVQPYNYDRRDYEAIDHYTFTDYPNGGLRTTARDLHRLLLIFANGGVSQNQRILAEATVNEMLTLQVPDLADDMGLQILLLDKAEGIWGHDGGEQGVATIAGFDPITKVGAIVLANQGEADLDRIFKQAIAYGKAN